MTQALIQRFLNDNEELVWERVSEFTWATILKAICSNAVKGKAVANKVKEELRKPDIC